VRGNGRSRTNGTVGKPSGPRVSLEDVRKLELRYTRAKPETIELVVEYVDGRVKVFEVDGFLIERQLEHLEKIGDEEQARGP
jgi:hypothetical protein